MKLKCTKNPEHKKFRATAHVTQDWIVNDGGGFVKIVENADCEVTHRPDSGDTYECDGDVEVT